MKHILQRSVLYAAAMVMLLSAANVPAQEQVIRRIRFPRGRTSATVKGSVRPEGKRYLYFFRARRGQRLTVRLTSADGNAVADIGAHNEFDVEMMQEGVTDWSGRLPFAGSGEYSIEVRSTGGKARYTLEFSVR